VDIALKQLNDELLLLKKISVGFSQTGRQGLLGFPAETVYE
jgi:hypothetical protein